MAGQSPGVFVPPDAAICKAVGETGDGPRASGKRRPTATQLVTVIRLRSRLLGVAVARGFGVVPARGQPLVQCQARCVERGTLRRPHRCPGSSGRRVASKVTLSSPCNDRPVGIAGVGPARTPRTGMFTAVGPASPDPLREGWAPSKPETSLPAVAGLCGRRSPSPRGRRTVGRCHAGCGFIVSPGEHPLGEPRELKPQSCWLPPAAIYTAPFRLSFPETGRTSQARQV